MMPLSLLITVQHNLPTMPDFMHIPQSLQVKKLIQISSNIVIRTCKWPWQQATSAAVASAIMRFVVATF
jgi:hypothetical protein